MHYTINNQHNDILNLDNSAIFTEIVQLENIKLSDDSGILHMLKHITKDQKKMHELSIHFSVTIYDLLRIIVTEYPKLVDKRFLTRMRKLYNTIS